MDGDGQTAGASAWLKHVKKTMKANKGKSLREVLKIAKKSYKKTRRGGGGLPPLPPSGGRRHRTRKGTRRA